MCRGHRWRRCWRNREERSRVGVISRRYRASVINYRGCPQPIALKPEGQIQLQQVVPMNWVHLRNILIASAGAQLVIDASGIAVPERPDDIVRKTVSSRGKESLEIPAPFEEVRIQEVGIQRILLDVLPIGTDFPRMPMGRGASYQSKAIFAPQGQTD